MTRGRHLSYSFILLFGQYPIPYRICFLWNRFRGSLHTPYGVAQGEACGSPFVPSLDKTTNQRQVGLADVWMA